MDSKKPESRTFGDYEILGELGRGGMGIVYKARETSLRRDVALKILPRSLSSNPNIVKRFLREARALAQLSLPNVVPVFAAGNHKRTYFIAMELIQGGSLARHLKKDGAFSLEEALRITRDVAGALSEAHRHGIVHRDIKPQNIMIDAKGVAKVLDFGLAQIATANTQLTADKTLLGTPAFMSPEQCEGKKLDVRSDAYSLGVTLYVMLTKKFPFAGEDALSMMFSITNGRYKDLKEVRPGAPAGVYQLVRNMLAKDPSHRYDSVRSLSSDLEKLLKDGNSPIGLPGGEAVAPTKINQAPEYSQRSEVFGDDDSSSDEKGDMEGADKSRGSRFARLVFGGIWVLSTKRFRQGQTKRVWSRRNCPSRVELAFN